MADPNAQLLGEAAQYLNDCWGIGEEDGNRWHVRAGEVCSLMQIAGGRSLYVKLGRVSGSSSLMSGGWWLSVSMLNDEPSRCLYRAFESGPEGAGFMEMPRLIQWVARAVQMTSREEGLR